MSDELRTKLKEKRIERGADLDREIALKTGVSEATQRRFRDGNPIREQQGFKLATYFGFPRAKAIKLAEECTIRRCQRTA